MNLYYICSLSSIEDKSYIEKESMLHLLCHLVNYYYNIIK